MVLDVSLTLKDKAICILASLYQLKYSLVHDNGRVDVANLRQIY